MPLPPAQSRFPGIGTLLLAMGAGCAPAPGQEVLWWRGKPGVTPQPLSAQRYPTASQLPNKGQFCLQRMTPH